MTSNDLLAVIGVSVAPTITLLTVAFKYSKWAEQMSGKVENQRLDHEELKAQVRAIADAFSHHLQDVATVKTDVEVIKNDVGWIRSNLEKAGSH